MSGERLGQPEGAIVWLVDKSYPYEGGNTEGVFSTELKALRFVAARAAEGTGGAEYRVFSVQVDVLDASSEEPKR